MNQPSNISIRQITADEIDALLNWRMEVLSSVFCNEFSLQDEAFKSQLRSANRAYYERALASGTHVACFAELDGNPVACGSFCLQEELPSPDNLSGKCAYVMNMYTRPEARGKGIATAVLNWVVDQAKARGAGKIYLETTLAGRAVYERAGFVDYPDMMKLADKS